jgi:hypothetical protein
MIDYDKLKLAHELAEKYDSEILYAYKSGDISYICWVTLEQLLLEMEELSITKCKYQVGQEVWRVNDEDDPIQLIIKAIQPGSDNAYLDDLDNWWVEEQLYPTREALIEAQIDYWNGLKGFKECQDDYHREICRNCGEFY